MTLLQILIFCLFALLVAVWLPQRWRYGAMLVGSLAAVYWLQSALSIRYLDFWFATASILLTVLVWAITQTQTGTGTGANQAGLRRHNLIQAGVITGVILLVALLRYAGPLCCLTPSRPPVIWQVFFGLAIAGTLIFLAIRQPFPRRWLLALMVLFILSLFIILKLEPLGQAASAGLRRLTGQAPELASIIDLRWLGFSYLAFRLLHVLRDVQAGRSTSGGQAPYTLGEFVTYALFFPTLTAGPIDRAPRFLSDLRHPQNERDRLVNGGWRIFWGIFKKFALADSLALISLNDQTAAQSVTFFWTWVLIYAYSLRIYLDFSGYTDIALGLGILLGFRLPENFDRPYLKTNLTTFWNSWHITLAQWFRAYYFNPLTRALRTRLKSSPIWITVFLGQTTTMLLIGLWHGITWNFAVWGLWHGLGLFIHNRWLEWMRSRQASHPNFPSANRLAAFSGWFITFHFVTLGWVWFALSDISLSLAVFQRLFSL